MKRGVSLRMMGLVGIVAILFVVHGTTAMILRGYSTDASETIEWLAAGSDLVLRGRITEVESKEHGAYEVVTAEVIETLKGTAPGRVIRFWGKDTYVALPF